MQKNNVFSFLKISIYVGIHSFLERFIFIYLILPPLVKNNGISTLTITNAIVVHEVAKTLFDTPSSILADKINAINVMIVGLLLKVLGMLCILLYKDFMPTSFFLAMFFVGTGSALMFSKIEPYVYINLKMMNCQDYFSRINLIRTISSNSAAIISGIVVGFFNHDNLHLVAIIAISCIMFLHIPMLIKMKADQFSGNKIENKRRLSSQIIKDAVQTILHNSPIRKSLFMLIIVNSAFFVITDCHKAIIANAKMTSRATGTIYSINHFFPILFAFFFFFKKQIPNPALAFKSHIWLMTLPALALLYGKSLHLLIFSVILFLAFIPVIRNAIVAEFERISLDGARFTLFSFVSLGTACMNITLLTLFGALSTLTSHENAFFFIISVFILTSAFLLKDSGKNNKSD